MTHMKSVLRSVYYDGLLYIANRIIARVPSHRVRLFFYRHVMGFSIGYDSHIFMDAWFDTKGRGSFVMGNHSVVNQKCRLDNRGRLVIGDNVAISSEVCILTADHDAKRADFAARLGQVTIGDYAFLGTRAMVLAGVSIGKGAIVAAGAIVTRDVPELAIVAGCPAKQIGTRNASFEYVGGYYRRFQ
jgi:maltose O-acetyltransferase